MMVIYYFLLNFYIKKNDKKTEDFNDISYEGLDLLQKMLV